MNMIEQSDVDFLYKTFQDSLENDEELLLEKFSERFQLAVAMEVAFLNGKSEIYNRVHAKTIKLSELWYCFELFKTVIDYGFGKKKTKSSEQSNKEWANAGRFSSFGTIDVDKVRKQNLFHNIDFTYSPFGNASLLDESYFSNKWFNDIYGNILFGFCLTPKHEQLISNDLIRMSLSNYLDDLQSIAQGEQRLFLVRGYNSLMGTSSEMIKSEEILSFIYALRCNYVHQGELPNSNEMPVEYKEFIVDECIKFLVSYCSVAYLTVIDELY